MNSVESKCEKQAEKLSQKRQLTKDPKKQVGNYWLDVAEKNIQTEKEHMQDRQARDSSFLYAVTLNSWNTELLKGFEYWPLVQRCPGYLTSKPYCGLCCQLFVWFLSKLFHPSSPHFQHLHNQGVNQGSKIPFSPKSLLGTPVFAPAHILKLLILKYET